MVYGELDVAQAPGPLLFSILWGRIPVRAESAPILSSLQGSGITLSRLLGQGCS
jgi:hypothetical protein